MPATAAAQDATATEPVGPNRRRVGLLASVLALVAFFGSVLFWLMHPVDEDRADAGSFFDTPSVLVHTFETGTTDTESVLVAKLLAQDITGALLRFSDLRAHTAIALQEKGAAGGRADPIRHPSLYTVRGIVWREDSKFLVRAELARNADEEVLWSGRYSESDLERGISGISSDISSHVASMIGQQYGAVRSETRKGLLSEGANPNLNSYACISRATEYRRTQREEGYWETRNCLEESVLREPELARGWAMLAYLRLDGVRFGYDREPARGQAYEHAREAAARALTLSPNDTDALKAMSHVLHYAGDLEQSIDYARRDEPE